MEKDYLETPKDKLGKRVEILEEIVNTLYKALSNQTKRNTELVFADSIYVEQIQLILKQRLMLFNVLGGIKKMLEDQGDPDHPFVHMMFEVMITIEKLDNEWKEKIGDTCIKSGNIVRKEL